MNILVSLSALIAVSAPAQVRLVPLAARANAPAPILYIAAPAALSFTPAVPMLQPSMAAVPVAAPMLQLSMTVVPVAVPVALSASIQAAPAVEDDKPAAAVLADAARALAEKPANAEAALDSLFVGAQDNLAEAVERSEPASVAELAERLKARSPDRDGILLRATSVDGIYSYRVSFYVAAGENPRNFVLERTVDFADSTWSAEQKLRKPYEDLAQPEFSTIPESEIVAHARAIHDYNNYAGKSFDDPVHYAEMIGHARRQKLEKIAVRLMHEDVKKDFESVGNGAFYQREPDMAVHSWKGWRLLNIVAGIRKKLEGSRSMDQLQERINALGDHDLFGGSVETFARPAAHWPAQSTHGPYTNTYAKSAMSVELPSDPALARKILAEIDRFFASHAN